MVHIYVQVALYVSLHFHSQKRMLIYIYTRNLHVPGDPFWINLDVSSLPKDLHFEEQMSP